MAKKQTPYAQDFYAPVPTRFTQWLRTNWIFQFFRFLILNFKMLRMVRKH